MRTPQEIRDFGQGVDFGRAASDYGTHRAGFPDAFFDALAARGLIRAGKRALDLGTGTGTVARGLAARGMAVTGLDPSAALLAEGARLDPDGLVRWVEGRAEATGLAPGFDLVAAGQCWHWFDRAKAGAEAARLLVPGGHLVIAHLDWLPLPGGVVAATEALIETANPDWRMGGGTGLYPDWLTDLAMAGFEGIESLSFDLSIPYSHEAWRGRIRASGGVGGSLPPAAVAEFDAAHAWMLSRDYPSEPLSVPHRVWAAFGRRPGGR